SPLHCALEKGDTKMVQMLLEHGADVNANDNMEPALFVAAKHGNEVATKALLDKGAEVNATNRWKSTALQAACFRGNTTIVQMIL
ncbi:ankyrin repeat protein, partial [Delphinella strobiligena]